MRLNVRYLSSIALRWIGVLYNLVLETESPFPASVSFRRAISRKKKEEEEEEEEATFENEPFCRDSPRKVEKFPHEFQHGYIIKHLRYNV